MDVCGSLIRRYWVRCVASSGLPEIAFTVTMQDVPEPASSVLLGVRLMDLGMVHWRRKASG